jgi:uncharacterized protein (DUF2062 family)
MSPMRAANICLVALTAVVAAFGASFVAAFVGAMAGSRTLGPALTLPAILGAAHLTGRWISQRDNPPSKPELLVGALLYAVMSLFAAAGSRHSEAMLFSFVSGAMAGFVLVRAALAAPRETKKDTAREPA